MCQLLESCDNPVSRRNFGLWTTYWKGDCVVKDTTLAPTAPPTTAPSLAPTALPTATPSLLTEAPSRAPSSSPTAPTPEPQMADTLMYMFLRGMSEESLASANEQRLLANDLQSALMYWLGDEDDQSLAVSAAHILVAFLHYSVEIEGQDAFRVVFSVHFVDDDGLKDAMLKHIFMLKYDNDSDRLCEIFENIVGERRVEDTIEVHCNRDTLLPVLAEDSGDSVMMQVLFGIGLLTVCVCCCFVCMKLFKKKKRRNSRKGMQMMLDIGGAGAKPMLIEYKENRALPSLPRAVAPRESMPPPPMTEEMIPPPPMRAPVPPPPMRAPIPAPPARAPVGAPPPRQPPAEDQSGAAAIYCLKSEGQSEGQIEGRLSTHRLFLEDVDRFVAVSSEDEDFLRADTSSYAVGHLRADTSTYVENEEYVRRLQAEAITIARQTVGDRSDLPARALPAHMQPGETGTSNLYPEGEYKTTPGGPRETYTTSYPLLITPGPKETYAAASANNAV